MAACGFLFAKYVFGKLVYEQLDQTIFWCVWRFPAYLDLFAVVAAPPLIWAIFTQSGWFLEGYQT